MKRTGALSILHLTRDIVYYNKAMLWPFSYYVGGKTVSKALKTIRNTKINAEGIAYFRTLKKRIVLKNKKEANWELGNCGNLGNFIPSILMSEFSILSYRQDQKNAFKKLGKKLARFLKFPSCPSFQPGQQFECYLLLLCNLWTEHWFLRSSFYLLRILFCNTIISSTSYCYSFFQENKSISIDGKTWSYHLF